MNKSWNLHRSITANQMNAEQEPLNLQLCTTTKWISWTSEFLNGQQWNSERMLARLLLLLLLGMTVGKIIFPNGFMGGFIRPLWKRWTKRCKWKHGRIFQSVNWLSPTCSSVDFRKKLCQYGDIVSALRVERCWLYWKSFQQKLSLALGLELNGKVSATKYLIDQQNN